jgi:hypothetical protein
MLLSLHLHSIGVKRRTISVLAGLGITPGYQTINNKRSEFAELEEATTLSSVYPTFPHSSNMLVLRANARIESDQFA